MLFPKIVLDSIIQIDDKFRIFSDKSFFTNDENLTDILIEPHTGDGFVSVFSEDNEDWYLDWAYEVAGEKTVSVKMIADSGEKIKTMTVTVLSVDDDALLSDDNDLIKHEPEIYDNLVSGKNSFVYAHRKAQERILAYLDEQRIWKNGGEIYTKNDLVIIEGVEFKEQFRQWSIYETLMIIFESSKVSNDDIFEEKKESYRALRNQSRTRGGLTLDSDNDGVADDGKYDNVSTRIVRR